MRVLHLADVHLDTRFARRSSRVRSVLQDASRTAFSRAVALAIEEGVDAVLIAGDLFDDDQLSFETERFLLQQMERLDDAGIQVVYATGNHDPGRAGLRAHSLEWPDNVELLRTPTPRRIPIRDDTGELVGWVTGAGHESASEARDLSADFPAPEGERPEVALLHTQVVGSTGGARHDRYAPSRRSRLCEAGFHYWALGHVHVRQAVSEDPPIHYPGSLQGKTPRETGSRGCLVVDLSDPRSPGVEFHPLAPVRWESVSVRELSEATTLRSLEGCITTAWTEARAGDPGDADTDWIVRFELQGPCALYQELRRPTEVETLEEEIAARLDLLDVEIRTDLVHAPVAVDDHRDRQDVLGEVLALARRAREDPELRAKLRPESLAGSTAGEVEDEDDYLRKLLAGIDAELVVRLLEGREA